MSCNRGLTRARRRHTWLAALPIIAMLPFVRPVWISEGLVGEGLEWLGYAALILCVLGRVWCTAYIGGRKRAELVTGGPYSVVRNPLYVFSFLGVVGIGLASEMITVTLFLAALFLVYYRVVVRREEQMLLAGFGAAYATYLARVPRWLPDFSLWRSPPDLVVRPDRLLSTICDSAWFFAALPAFEILERLHAGSVIPALLHLP